jgi:NAD(P)-dependent dehydrogenase (short-subunit alcohol dehydrogenase family)
MTQTILITGASSGIGKATALHFQARGWNVIATMRSPERETDLSGLERVLVTRLDVQDVSSIESAVKAGLARFGRIDALLNNAGYGAYGPLEVTPLEAISRQFEVNVLGLLATTKAVLPHFRAQKSGVILNVSSMGGRMTFPLGTLYHGSKFAVEGLSEALHFELLPLGIRVKIIEPGAIQTDFAGRSFDFSNDPSLAEYQPLVGTLFAALGPMMANASPPSLVAEAIFHAATDGADQLRYEVGPDAVHLLAARRASDDATFLAHMRAQFGLS